MENDYQSLDELLNKCTVRIKVEGGQGTGFFVAPGLILTCAHVIEDALKDHTPVSAYCNFNQATLPIGQIGAEDVFLGLYPDLALLRMDLRDHPCVLLGTEFRAFTDFYSYGYTKEHPDGESTTVECEGTLEYGGTLIKLKEGQVQPGASGSPLLNRITGSVCGMITNTRDRNSDLGGAGVPISTVFAKFPELERANVSFHQSDDRWNSLLKKELEIKASNSVVAILYTETGKITRPKHFIGRQNVLTKIDSMLDQSHRVLLTGMAGIGKTTLAQVVVDEWLRKGRAAVIWVEVKHESTDAIIEAIANRFEDNQISKLKHIDEKLPALKGLLERSKASLLVLENVHNVAAADKTLGAVPESMPVLITSRQRFAVEEIVEVDVLAPADALKILEQTSGIQDLSNNADATFLCEQLGYHPYALELAGFMMRELARTPRELRRRLADAPLDLTSSTRGRLRALLDDSAAHLDAKTRAALFAFGVFPSNGATSALLAVYLEKHAEEISTSLDELVKRHLIKRRPDTEFYYMHDLTFYYVAAQSRPDSQEEIDMLEESLLRYLTGHPYDFDLLALDLQNILTVADKSAPPRLVEIMSWLALGGYPDPGADSYLVNKGHSLAFLERLDRAIAYCRKVAEAMEVILHFLIGKRGDAYFNLGDYKNAVSCYEEAIVLAPDKNRRAILLSVAARTYAIWGDDKTAKKYFKASYQLAEKLEDELLAASIMGQESYAASARGDFRRIQEIASKQVVLTRRLIDKTPSPQAYKQLFFSLLNLGSAEIELSKQGRGSFESAQPVLQEVYEIAVQQNSDVLLAYALNTLGENYHYLDNRADAGKCFGQALILWRELGLLKFAKELEALMRSLHYSIPS